AMPGEYLQLESLVMAASQKKERPGDARPPDCFERTDVRTFGAGSSAQLVLENSPCMKVCSVGALLSLDQAAASCGEPSDGSGGSNPKPFGALCGTIRFAVSGELRCGAGVGEPEAI